MSESLSGPFKDELSRVHATSLRTRVAQTAAAIRVGGQTVMVGPRAVIVVTVDRRSVARRLAGDIHALHGRRAEVIEARADSPDGPGRYVIRVVERAPELLLMVGLTDRHGTPVRGLPAHTVSGPRENAEALLRGAFMTTGVLSTGHRPTAVVTVPNHETSMALAGAARRLEIAARIRPSADDGLRVMVRDTDAIGGFLRRIGAPATSSAWLARRSGVEEHERPDVYAGNFESANQRRAEQTAAVAVARIRRAFEILGDDAPPHLAVIGRLRIDNPAVTLQELGRLADPPVTKDAAAGRIRRLLDAADAHAAATGIADTTGAPDVRPSAGR